MNIIDELKEKEEIAIVEGLAMMICAFHWPSIRVGWCR